jgi:hypothetical protein
MAQVAALKQAHAGLPIQIGQFDVQLAEADMERARQISQCYEAQGRALSPYWDQSAWLLRQQEEERALVQLAYNQVQMFLPVQHMQMQQQQATLADARHNLEAAIQHSLAVV